VGNDSDAARFEERKWINRNLRKTDELVDEADRRIAEGDLKGALSKLNKAHWVCLDTRGEAIEQLGRISALAGRVAGHTDGRLARKARAQVSRSDRARAAHEVLGARGEIDQHRQLALAEIDERRQQAFGDSIAVISGCRVLGGSGLAPMPGDICELVFTRDALELYGFDGHAATIGYDEISAIEIGGPGQTQSGGGFIGGGFGVQGAAEGMLIATALNLLTTRTKIDTVICIQTRTAELFLHHGAATPDALRMLLSPIFTRMRQHDTAARAVLADSSGGNANIVDRLQQLADLRASGALSEEEFAAAKAKLLD
jgi:hypothetical protein